MSELADLVLAMTLEAHSVEAQRVEATEHTPVDQVIEALRGELTSHFQAAWDDGEDWQLHRTGKRMGKSEYGGRRLFRGAAQFPKSVNPYIGPTAKAARLRMWPIIKRIARAHFPDAKINESMMTVTLATGGTVVVGGCENKNDIGNWFGMPFAEAFVDECGTFPSYLQELIDDGLEPSMMDFHGNIVLAGNPGIAPTGYWHELTGPARLSTIPLYTGDARDNPHVNAAEYFAKKLRQKGWTEQHPTFQRMYLGNWAWDPEAMCFPYNAERNAIDKLPETSLGGGALHRSAWRFVIAADVAGVGITAIVILCCHPGDPRSFFYSAEQWTAWLPEDLVARVDTLRTAGIDGYDLSRAPFVVDTGGLGSVHALYMTKKSGTYFEPADKRDKKSWIRDVHDELLSARAQVIAANCGPLIDEWLVLEWDDDAELWVEGPPDHCADAGGYGKRRLNQFVRAANTAPHEESEVDRARRIAHEAKARRMREMSRSAGRSSWR